jgi:hypothetical protein
MKTILIPLCLSVALPVVGSEPVRHSTTTARADRIRVAEAVRSVRPETLRANEYLLELNLGAVPQQGHEVYVRRGSAWQAETAAVTVQGGRTNLIVQGNEQYILRPRSAVTVPQMSATKNYMPGVLIQTERASGSTPPEIIQGELFVRPRPMPLMWDTAQSCYAAKLVVGLDVTNQTRSMPLQTPITVQFFPSSSEIRPVSLVLTNTGAEGYREVDFYCRHRGEQARVTVRSDLGEVHFDEIALDVRLGKLVISSVEDRIPGFGLGTTTLTVQRLAEDGQPLMEDTPLDVQLSAEGGAKLDPADALTIPAGKHSVTVQLRSRGVGSRTIKASTGSIGAFVPMRFDPPVGFLVAVLLGGVIGGLAKSFGAKDGGSISRIRLIAEGSVVGLVFVAAVTAGLMILSFPFPALGTELGAFLLAAISGYYGAPVMDHLVGIVFPKPKVA